MKYRYASNAKKGALCKRLKIKSTKTTNASTFTTSRYAIHKTPDSLTQASLATIIANTKVSVLIKPESSNANTAWLLEIKIIPCCENILMVIDQVSLRILGKVWIWRLSILILRKKMNTG